MRELLVRVEPRRALVEAAYAGNIGFEEMMKLYMYGTKRDQDEMDRLLKSGNFKKAWEFLKKVTGVELVDPKERR